MKPSKANAELGRAEAKAVEQKEDRVAALDAKVFRCLARGRDANIEVGRALIELKQILGHGKWQRHIEEKFAFSLRTAERYMRLAKAEAESKSDKVTVFKPASDPEAVKIRSATDQAQAEVGRTVLPLLERKEIYKLALHLSMDERNATDQLWNSPCRTRAEKKIIDLLKRLYVEFRIVNEETS